MGEGGGVDVDFGGDAEDVLRVSGEDAGDFVGV